VNYGIHHPDLYSSYQRKTGSKPGLNALLTSGNDQRIVHLRLGALGYSFTLLTRVLITSESDQNSGHDVK